MSNPDDFYNDRLEGMSTRRRTDDGVSLPRRRPLVVGLTGGVGCGKTVVAQEFAKRGAVVISGDEIGHDVVGRNPGLQRKLAAEFGRDILTRKKINRRRLARRAFATPEGWRRLNELVHPVLIRDLIKRVRAARQQPKTLMIVVDAALIVEWKMKDPIDLLVAVRASRADRRRWLRKRGWTPDEIEDRMKAQASFAARERVADVVLRNDGDVAALRRKAKRLWQKLLNAR
jgi:dephospho-CoA kinase